MSDISQNDQERACEKIDGYYNPAPHESALKKYEQAFDRAKAECINHLEKQLADIKKTDFQVFGRITKRSKLFGKDK